MLRIVIYPEDADTRLLCPLLGFIENVALICGHNLFILGPKKGDILNHDLTAYSRPLRQLRS